MLWHNCLMGSKPREKRLRSRKGFCRAPQVVPTCCGDMIHAVDWQQRNIDTGSLQPLEHALRIVGENFAISDSYQHRREACGIGEKWRGQWSFCGIRILKVEFCRLQGRSAREQRISLRIGGIARAGDGEVEPGRMQDQAGDRNICRIAGRRQAAAGRISR